MGTRNHEKLIAWQESYQLTLFVYRETAKFPIEEKFALVSQMRRAAYSIPSNIAEGNAKRSKKEKSRFYEIAKASLEELHVQCRLAKDLAYWDDSKFMRLDTWVNKISYLLIKMYNSLH